MVELHERDAPGARGASVRVCAAELPVTRVESLCREHVEIELDAGDFPPSEPGQFLGLLCRRERTNDGIEIEWQAGRFPSLHGLAWGPRDAYLRRPFSIADRWTTADGASRLVVISRTIGPGTAWLEHLRPGEKLNVTGPLGRGFRVPDGPRALVLAGGGVGIPPLLYLSRELWAAGRRDVTVIFGALRRDLLPIRLTGEPRADGTPARCAGLPGGAAFGAIVTTDDGSVGFRGRVVDGLAVWRARRPDVPATVFACGPEGMLRGIAGLAAELRLECQLCVERHMGCGMGTCLSCVVRVRDASRPGGWRWALSCTEGPVFDARELVDYAPPDRSEP